MLSAVLVQRSSWSTGVGTSNARDVTCKQTMRSRMPKVSGCGTPEGMVGKIAGSILMWRCCGDGNGVLVEIWTPGARAARFLR